MSSRHPYYRKINPSPKLGEDKFAGGGTRIDFSNLDVHLAAFDEVEAVAKANARFDDRAAAVVRAAVGPRSLDSFWLGIDLQNLMDAGLLEATIYYVDFVGELVIISPTRRCLAILAYPDFFFPNGLKARSTISEAVLMANPGWCGTFGPVDPARTILTRVVPIRSIGAEPAW